MSGEQDRWDMLDSSHQLDPREATLDLSRLIEQLQPPRPAGNGGGKHAAGPAREERAAFASAAGTASSRGASAPQDVPSAASAPTSGRLTAEAIRNAPPGNGATSTWPTNPTNGSSLAHDTSLTDDTSPAHDTSLTRDTSLADDDGARGAWPAEGAWPAWGTRSAPEPTVDHEPSSSEASPPPEPSPPPEASAPELNPPPEPNPPEASSPEASSPEPSDRAARQPRPGSLADLRQRLERLPHGHPSSPYHVDGERKPQPPRLKHLELAPAGREQLSDLSRPLPPAGHDQPTDLPRPMASPGTPAATTPEQPADHRPPDRDSASLPRRTAADPGAAPEQPEEGPGLPLLTQPQLRIAQDVYDRFRALEGRSIFGSYTEGGLTARMREVERQLTHGRLAPDTDQRALLGADAFKARLADQIWRHPDRAVDLLARSVPGALSYTFVFDPNHYAAGTWLVQDALQARRFQLLARKNSWSSREHKRVVTMWHDPQSGLRFEVQFHTHASLEAQQLARTSADLIADPRIPRAEAQTLRSDLAATWAALPPPPGNAAIGDYRRSPSASPRN